MEALNSGVMIDGREMKWRSWTLTKEIPAGESEVIIDKTISEGMLFDCRKIGGMFETLHFDGADIVDNGVCQLEVKLTDSGTNYEFTDTFVPGDLLLSPGRRKSIKATNNDTAPAGESVYQYAEFIHKFTNKLEVRVTNLSNTPTRIWVEFFGYYGRK